MSRLDERRRLREADRADEDSVLGKIGHLLDPRDGDTWGGPVKLERQAPATANEGGHEGNGNGSAPSPDRGAVVTDDDDGVAWPANGNGGANGHKEELGLALLTGETPSSTSGKPLRAFRWSGKRVAAVAGPISAALLVGLIVLGSGAGSGQESLRPTTSTSTWGASFDARDLAEQKHAFGLATLHRIRTAAARKPRRPAPKPAPPASPPQASTAGASADSSSVGASSAGAGSGYTSSGGGGGSSSASGGGGSSSGGGAATGSSQSAGPTGPGAAIGAGSCSCK